MPNVKLVKKNAFAKKSPQTGAKAGPAVDFVFVDNQDDTCTVLGTDAAGNTVDISTVASIAVTSSDASKVSVDPPVGATFAMHAVGPTTTPGTPVVISVTATWNDGSVGPFSFDLPVDVVSGPVSGVVIKPGTPTSR